MGKHTSVDSNSKETKHQRQPTDPRVNEMPSQAYKLRKQDSAACSPHLRQDRVNYQKP